MAMSLNPQYDTIGKTFIQQYYAMFDDPNLRQNLLTFYNEEKSLMTFEGEQIFGRTKIMEKIQGLRFQKICHHCTVIDSQPMFDGGILISVLGQLKTDDDPAHTFLQVFVLKPMGETFYVEHDIFRLALHHTA
ncbi:probable nuclear transport factor 2 [Ixodes scapularis]|uniref:NTF2-related export protein n=3 Tax=Ixodes TaxID=6944 RepID=A0A0K8RAN0_IXORI|nr:probable nuclear transport factor 2 [Ixodes scapularis]